MFPTLTGLETDRRVREVVGRQVQQVMASGEVKEAGFLAGRRGLFLLIDVEAAEELYALLGPECYSHFDVQVSPVASVEQVGQLFQQWAQDGR
jgi:hypothetical protein